MPGTSRWRNIGLGIALLAALGWAGERTVAAWVWRRLDLHPQPAKTVPAGLPDLSARTCGGCHPTQFDAWAGSRMGRAMVDPVFVEDWAAHDHSFVCRVCHAPLIEQQPTVVTGLRRVRPLTPIEHPNPSYRPDLVDEGVTCVACHLVDGAIVGPDGGNAPHPVRADPAFREAGRCEGCHQLEIPPLANLDRPLSDTHREWEAWKAATGRTETCADCHMPGRSHAFPGGRDPALLRAGLEVAVARDPAGTVVTLRNRAGHRFPTGDPARALVVRVGTEEVVLARRVPLPRLRDEGDATLRPDETRALRFGSRGPVVVEMQPLRFLASGPRPDAVEIVRVP